jgi:hypothetical protein
MGLDILVGVEGLERPVKLMNLNPPSAETVCIAISRKVLYRMFKSWCNRLP